MKLVKSFIAISLMFIPLIIFNTSFTGYGNSTSENDTSDMGANESIHVDEIVYPHDEVIDVNIKIDEDDYDQLITSAIEEEYYDCDITYNGYTLTDVAIRAKGNSSLKDVAKSGDDRFSWNIDLNYYLDQDLFGIDKLILNNLFKDPTMMAEYISYEALNSLDVVSSRTTFVALYINNEYYGIYLSVEHVSNEFLDANYGNSDGELYKPEMGKGSDLDYTTDNRNSYTGLVNEQDTSDDTILELLKAIDTGEDIEDIFNVDSFLQYLAVSTFTIHLDSYQGTMYHNYYLYNNNGVYEWISWDLNMTFNGFIGSQMTDEEAMSYLIDEPVTGSLEKYPLVETILSNEEYLEIYHSHLQDLLDNYFEKDQFENRVLEIYELIKDYVKTDSNSFFSYLVFEKSLFSDSTEFYSILTFAQERSINIQAQLDGDIPSTNNGNGNTGSSRLPNQNELPINEERPMQPPINNPLEDNPGTIYIQDDLISSPIDPMLITGVFIVIGFSIYLWKK